VQTEGQSHHPQTPLIQGRSQGQVSLIQIQGLADRNQGITWILLSDLTRITQPAISIKKVHLPSHCLEPKSHIPGQVPHT
jgi:hypothetical protein